MAAQTPHNARDAQFLHQALATHLTRTTTTDRRGPTNDTGPTNNTLLNDDTEQAGDTIDAKDTVLQDIALDEEIALGQETALDEDTVLNEDTVPTKAQPAVPAQPTVARSLTTPLITAQPTSAQLTAAHTRQTHTLSPQTTINQAATNLIAANPSRPLRADDELTHEIDTDEVESNQGNDLTPQHTLLPPIITHSRWQLTKPAIWGTALIVLIVTTCLWINRPDNQVHIVSRSRALGLDGDPPAAAHDGTRSDGEAGARHRPGAGVLTGATAAGNPTSRVLAPTAGPGEPPPSTGAENRATAAPLVSPGTGAAPQAIAIHIVGQVKKPGVWFVPEGSLVLDVVTKAGGLTSSADATAINLARKVSAGEHIYVPAPGEKVPTLPAVAQPTPKSSGTSRTGADGKGSPAATPTPVNVNTASAQELEQLPGIGPVTAERIVQWRLDNGPFMKSAELRQVRGIGPALMKQLRGRVTTR